MAWVFAESLTPCRLQVGPPARVSGHARPGSSGHTCSCAPTSRSPASLPRWDSGHRRCRTWIWPASDYRNTTAWRLLLARGGTRGRCAPAERARPL
eukprot:14255722-Heterocapsa_arctica.AAC.1